MTVLFILYVGMPFPFRFLQLGTCFLESLEAFIARDRALFSFLKNSVGLSWCKLSIRSLWEELNRVISIVLMVILVRAFQCSSPYNHVAIVPIRVSNPGVIPRELFFLILVFWGLRVFFKFFFLDIFVLLSPWGRCNWSNLITFFYQLFRPFLNFFDNWLRDMTFFYAWLSFVPSSCHKKKSEGNCK